MAEFDGSIYAYVGADIADYQAAMNKNYNCNTACF